MDYEKKYKEALERVRRLHDRMLVLSSTDALVASAELEFIFPELTESEDEKIRKGLVKLLTVAGEAYVVKSTGIKKDSYLAWLEKQKETENVSASTMIPSCWAEEPSDDELQRYQDELYDFKVFATKQAKEHHISFVHDFEWNNFCAGLLSYFNEQKPKAKAKSPLSPHELYDAKIEGISQGRQDVLDHPEQFGLQKPAEWSEEDKEKIVTISEIIEHFTTILYSGGTLTLNKEYKKELLCFIKSLRPSWKPSEDELTKKHLEGYIKGRNDALREMSDFMESHFNTQSGTSIKSGGNE